MKFNDGGTLTEYAKIVGYFNPCKLTTFTVAPFHNDANEANIFEIAMKYPADVAND